MKKLILIILCILSLYACVTPKKSKHNVFNAPFNENTTCKDSTIVLDTTTTTYKIDYTKIVIGTSMPNDGFNANDFIPKDDVRHNIAKHKGLITYFIPDTVNWGEFTTVELRITKNKKTTDFVLKNKNAVIDSIRVGNEMHVQLIDIENAFQIKELSSATQAIEDGDEFTVWKWSISRQRVGNTSWR